MSGLTWGLAIATYNRREMLVRAVTYALEQTRPPVEVVISDSSGDADATEVAVRAVIDRLSPGVRFVFDRSPVAQQTAQRNRAAARCTADVLFMIDDDTFMVPTCAERILSVYEADPTRRIAAVGPALARAWPIAPAEIEAQVRDPKPSPPPWPRRLLRWLKGAYTLFYFPAPLRTPGRDVPSLDIPAVSLVFLVGCTITVRREVVLKSPFDENLIINDHEDTDATYRFTERGLVLYLPVPLMYHAAAARPAAMGRRGSLSRFAWNLNLAYMVRKWFGDSTWVRLHCFVNWARFAMHDLALGLVRRDLSRLRGCLLALRPLWHLALAPQATIGRTLRQESARARQQLALSE